MSFHFDVVEASAPANRTKLTGPHHTSHPYFKPRS